MRHLLGKKSWNVYNQDNIERVQRDEEQARHAEKDAERRKRDEDAADRLRLLRGDATAKQELVETYPVGNERSRISQDDGDTLADTSRRRGSARKPEEDVTGKQNRNNQSNTSDDPLDHISNMRFRDAAGRHADALTPWYNSFTSSNDATSSTHRDVWGNEDAGRQSRDQQRMIANDPLLAMKRGVKQLREAEKQKADWMQERERDLVEVEKLARRERRRRRKGEENRRVGDRDRYKDRHRHRRRHRSRSRSPGPQRSKSRRNES